MKIFPSCIVPNKMLLSVSADVKQATIVQVKFQKWLSKMKVIGTKELTSRNEITAENFHPKVTVDQAEIKSTLCQKRASEPGEEH